MATLAIIGGAQAQSSVTLFGVVDAAVGHYSVSGGQSVTALVSSGYNSSRLGFRGTEDLGGGLAASFWLEAGLNNDNGSFGTTATTGTSASTGGGGLVFNRRSTVSLSGGFGEIRIGRDYTPTFWNDTVFDPFGTNGVGTNIVSVVNGAVHTAAGFTDYVRSSNTVGYFLPSNLGGFYGQVQYGFAEQPAAGLKADGRYVGGRFGFANGPVDVALAWGKTSGSDAFLLPGIRTINLGGSYNLGPVKLIGEYSKLTLQLLGASADAKGWLLGASVPVGVGEIRAAYSRGTLDSTTGADPRGAKLALGYVHNLSKRTALYGTYAHVSNKNGMTLTASGSNGYTGPTGIANASSNGYEFGIRHSF